jgi:hypothetical protein
MLKWESPAVVTTQRRFFRRQASARVARALETMQAVRLDGTIERIPGVMLEPAEVAYSIVSVCELVERREAVQAELPRERAGTRDDAVDVGMFVITNRRCLFIGARRSREWPYSKLRAVTRGRGATAVFSLGDDVTATGVRCHNDEHLVSSCISAAIARYQDAELHVSLIEQVEDDYRAAWSNLQELEAQSA